MSEQVHRAPHGKFIVGETLIAENEWVPVGEPHETLEAALHMARELNLPHRPELQYYVYDENGLVQESLPTAG